MFSWFFMFCDFCVDIYAFQGFPGGSVVKNPATNARDTWNVGSVPGLGRSPGEENSNPSQHSCLENPADRGAWRATVPGVPKTQTQQANMYIVCIERNSHLSQPLWTDFDWESSLTWLDSGALYLAAPGVQSFSFSLLFSLSLSFSLFSLSFSLPLCLSVSLNDPVVSCSLWCPTILLLILHKWISSVIQLHSDLYR